MRVESPSEIRELKACLARVNPAQSRIRIFSKILLYSAWIAVTATAIAGTPTLGNYPDTSISLSANTTVTPDAAPTNTTRINVSTSTNFQGTIEGDPTTGIVRVTDARPPGTYVVTLKAFNGIALTTTRTFTLTVAIAVTCTDITFAQRTIFGTGTEPNLAAVGDFNRDGKQDLAVANFRSSVSILLGDGAGHFGIATNFTIGDGAHSMVVGDFNGDGKQDLATANFYSGDVSILLGDGTGAFGAVSSFPTGNYPTSIALGDFNRDGKQDLAVTNSNFGKGDISVLLGDGAGHFSVPINFVAGTFPAAIVSGDFNGDGKQDLAVANTSSDDVSILLGNGAGNFSAPTNVGVGLGPESIALGDFNGDGKQDLTTANYSNNNVSILLGDGMGHFTSATRFVGNGPRSVTVGDFNGDYKQDLATSNYNANNVSILLGDGAGHFSASTTFLASNGISVRVGDFNGDGKQDLVVPDNSMNVQILLRTCVFNLTPSPTPSATASATATPTIPPTPTPTPTPTPSTAQALNISTRLRVETGNNRPIAGFIISGDGDLQVVIRGLGPSLGQLGVPDFLVDPVLEGLNDNWQDDPSQAAQLTKLGLAPTNPLESAIVETLLPGAHTAILSGKEGGTGVGLVEVYNVDSSVPVANIELANISTRGLVQTGNNVMIGGFILGSGSNSGIIVRGIGPSLSEFGIPNALADPTLELRDNNGALIVGNDNWQDDPAMAAQLSAHGLAPSNPNESGIFVELQPNLYTAILAGKDGGVGVGLVEIYNVH